MTGVCHMVAMHALLYQKLHLQVECTCLSLFNTLKYPKVFFRQMSPVQSCPIGCRFTCLSLSELLKQQKSTSQTGHLTSTLFKTTLPSFKQAIVHFKQALRQVIAVHISNSL